MTRKSVFCVQIGTACVTRGQDSRLALGRLGALVEQLETLVRGGREVILVTSGMSSASSLRFGSSWPAPHAKSSQVCSLFVLAPHRTQQKILPCNTEVPPRLHSMHR